MEGRGNKITSSRVSSDKIHSQFLGHSGIYNILSKKKSGRDGRKIVYGLFVFLRVFSEPHFGGVIHLSSESEAQELEATDQITSTRRKGNDDYILLRFLLFC